MSVLLLTRRYLAEYIRNPVNLLLLVIVPIVFVTMAAGTFADLAKIAGGTGSTPGIEADTAGWAAAFLTGVAAFFQVRSAHAADRRLAQAGLGAGQVVAARLLSGLGLSVLAGVAALLALAARSGIADLPRTVAALALYALIYLGIGTLVGVLLHDELNGAVVLLFVWMLDVFLSPAMIGGDQVLTRPFPTHFVSLFLVGAPDMHTGPLGNLGWALLWTVGALLLAGLTFVAAIRPASPRVGRFSWRENLRPWSHGADVVGAADVRQAALLEMRPHSRPPRPDAAVSGSTPAHAGRVSHSPGDRAAGNAGRVAVAFRYGLLAYSRNPVLWVLLVALPAVYIRLSVAVTPPLPDPVALDEHGRQVTYLLSMTNVHAATMAAMAVASLAGLVGLFVVLGSAEGDRRLVLAGYRARTVLATRVGVLAVITLLVTAVSLAVTVPTFTPRLWLPFVGGTVLIALTYGLIGVLVGPLAGRMGGLYLLFLLPFVDVGLGQAPVFQAAPPTWATFLPAYGGMRLVVDGAFAPDFSAMGALLLALGWLVAIAIAALVIFRRISESATG